MIITQNKVVAIDYCLKNSEGKVLDSSKDLEPLEYLHGHNDIIPGLEKALEGKNENDSFEVIVEPDEGYGEYNDKLVMDIPRDQFPKGVDIVEGAGFEADSPDGPVQVTVTNVGKDMITVDANHPFAGERLFFEVTVLSVRDATEDEIENGLDNDIDCDGDCENCDDYDDCDEDFDDEFDDDEDFDDEFDDDKDFDDDEDEEK